MSYFTKVFRSAPKAEQTDPDADLASFRQSWEHVKETLQHPDERQLARGITFTDVPAELRLLVNHLVSESSPAADTTGPCLEYMLKHDVLATLVRLSSKDRPFGVRAEVVKAMLNLVVLMDEHFLVHATVHKAVLRLLRSCVRDESQSFDGGTKAMGAAGASRGRPIDYEEDLVDLMCALCSRIRLYPQLLLIFFHDKHVYHDLDEDEAVPGEEGEDEDHPDLSFTSTQSGFTAARRSISPTPSGTTITSAPTTSSFYRRPEYEFLVYNYLLRFVHREGKIGDSARTGLLFLMDVAMSARERSPLSNTASPPTVDPLTEASLAFAEYILESDFADVLAAALGAVYSLLPSKLIVRRQGGAGKVADDTMVLGGIQSNEDESEMDEELERARAFGMDVSTSPEFKARLAHFVKMVDFVQEVILRQTAPSDDLGSSSSSTLGGLIVKSILKFLRSSFLANVLYPSILECSDEDGSAVAVITYLDAILNTVKDSQMSEVIINFLTSEDEDESAKEHANVTTRRKKPRRPAKHQPKQSTAMTLLQLETNTRKKSTYYNSLGRFTVKDLLLSNLESKSQITANAALKLLNTLLTQHGLLTLPRIFTLIPDSTALTNGHSLDEDDLKTPRPGFPASEDDLFSPGFSQRAVSEEDLTALRYVHREVDDSELWRQLVARVDPAFAAEVKRGANTKYLQDAQDWLETQLLWTDPLLDPEEGADQSLSLPERRYRLSPTDPLLAQLLSVTQRFFSHTSEMNLSLTGVIHAIACSPQLSLADWLTHNSSSLGSAQPAMYTCMASLSTQLPKYRSQAPKFDEYLEQRRRGLLSSALQDADVLSTPVALSPSEPLEPSAPSTPVKKPRYSGFVAYFSPSRARAASEAHVDTPIHSRQESREATLLERHYRETRAVHLTPLKGVLPANGPWSPARLKRPQPEHEEVSALAWGGEREAPSGSKTPEREETTTTLSELLDNVVVLEEALKEIAAVVQMRRVMGIDD
ncbi:hypothetical protein CALVIDRAFT_594730 [Calocera viscosa TUFC12733]|uniref:FHF complex subunit HOOK-interacting protein C-terminal domain-containing protein n=1 Tax=Calocera viscosa (strain TUFC12733) TaxID=1330018 RepID=A0A167RSG7_CALVF|nr:hypothetical protein CALVIDRAFT_594730 [Calocera viscosa TUFC12733]